MEIVEDKDGCHIEMWKLSDEGKGDLIHFTKNEKTLSAPPLRDALSAFKDSCRC
jgi:hypothetical protein